MLERRGSACVRRKYDDDVQATLNVWNDGLSSMIEGMRAHGFDASAPQAMKNVLDLAAARGFGEMDLASVFEVLISGELAR
jgi:hypothetical protein